MFSCKSKCKNKSKCNHCQNTNSTTEIVISNNKKIIGDWTTVNKELNLEDGYRFLNNGKLEFINMFSWNADGWSIRDNDSLVLYHHTERYPQKDSSVYKISEITDSTLSLISSVSEIKNVITYHRK